MRLKPSARTRILVTATACTALSATLVAGAANATPISAAVAASANAVFGSPTSEGSASSLVIGTLSTSTADADAALEAARADLAAAVTVSAEVAESGLPVADAAIDTTSLRTAIVDLAQADVIPVLLFPDLADNASAQAEAVSIRVSEVRATLDAARAEKAAADAAAQAQRDAEAAAAAQAAALAAANTPEGAKTLAQQMAAERYGWGPDQFSCLSSLWQKESSWNYQAYNASSGATGIPQALPGSKMASAGSDWQTNAATQIAWGLDYIDRAYGSPCGAWGKSQASGWY